MRFLVVALTLALAAASPYEETHAVRQEANTGVSINGTAGSLGVSVFGSAPMKRQAANVTVGINGPKARSDGNKEDTAAPPKSNNKMPKQPSQNGQKAKKPVSPPRAGVQLPSPVPTASFPSTFLTYWTYSTAAAPTSTPAAVHHRRRLV